MNALRSGSALAWLALLVALPLAPSCSRAPDSAAAVDAGGVPGGSPWLGVVGPMFVEDCSLGCGSGAGGVPVSCSEQFIHVNEQFAVRFSRLVDLLSVSPSSFRLRRIQDGSSVAGAFFLRPGDARQVVFEPQLAFDPLGNPIFAMQPNEAYELVLPSPTANDPPPYVRSTEGRANQSPADCLLITTEGVRDYSPGAPEVRILVDVIDQSTGETLPDQETPATDVSPYTAVDFEFDDVMNLATVVNPSTGESPFLRVEVDLDGNVMTLADRVEIDGSWEVAYQTAPPLTLATFTPAAPLPTRGPGSQPRRMLAVFEPGVLDLAGNPLAPGERQFVTIRAAEMETSLPGPGGEPFDDSANEDVAASGAAWGAGQLTFGQGGGSGRHGRLSVALGESFSFDTDGTTFPLPGAPNDVLTNESPQFDYPPLDPSMWPTVTVTDGNFEFGALSVEAGGVLGVEGFDAARLFSRGDLALAGVLDAAGASASAHQGNSGNEYNDGQLTAFGGEGGAPGPNGGEGGAGADRFNHGDNASQNCPTTPMLNAGGILFDPDPPMNPGTDNDGRPGIGVGGTRAGGGRGGLHWPPNPPRTLSTTAQPCWGDSEFSIVPQPGGGFSCRIAMVAGPGGGGGYALPGVDGMAFSPYAGQPSQPGLLPLTPEPTLGGDTTLLELEPPGTVPPLVRDLDWHDGELRGGAGGGGGGMSVWGSKTIVEPAGPGSDCFGTANMFPYWDHSGAGGGGAGGATQLVSGRTLRVSGILAAAGGDGGSSLDPTAEITDCSGSPGELGTSCTSFAAPGGGGSGGAVKLQGVTLSIADQAARLSVAGGTGGVGTGGSIGGDGAPGLVRLEQLGGGLDPSQLAPRIEPYLPGQVGFNHPYPSAAILSLGAWEASTQRPDSYSGSTSCWMKAEDPYYELVFEPYGNGSPDPNAYGWNMEVLYQTANGVKAFPYYGISNDPDFPLGNTSFAQFLGNTLNHDEPEGEGSLFCVRFQAARFLVPPSDLCDIDLDPAAGQVVPGSVTPWVSRSNYLNTFELGPNMVRFTVAFDRSLVNQNAITQNIRGITNLRINVTPE